MNTNRSNLMWAGIFVGPWVLGFLLFTAYPFFASLWYSFTNYNIVRDAEFIGLYNYEFMFFKDIVFWVSIGNTFYFAITLVIFGTIVDIFLAALLNRKIVARATYRLIYFIPVLVPTVASSLIWIWVLNPQRGIVNYLLEAMGLVGPNWLGSTTWVKPALVIMAIWGSGRAIIIFLAGLQEIPRHLYEAARIDGAGPITVFRHITLPLLTPVILFNVVVGLIFSFQAFAESYIMTQGGPANASLFYGLNLYFHAFENLRMGYASALAWLLFMIIMFFTLVVFRGTRRWVYYENE